MRTHFQWGTSNTKVRATGRELGGKIVELSLPAYQSRTGKRICPGAAACIAPCYARDGFFQMETHQDRYEHNFEHLQDIDASYEFLVDDLINLAPRYVRIHAGGDFFSPEYLELWMRTAWALPDITFGAYSKSVDWINAMRNDLPDNLRIACSYGGKFDHLIDEQFQHAKVFHDHRVLRAAGYVDSSKHDGALFRGTVRIGLVIHGRKARLIPAETLVKRGFLHE